MELDRRAIGKRIAAARRARSWTQADLAAAVGVRENTIALWETGIRLPRLPLLVEICRHVRRSLDWIVLGTAKRGALWR